MTRKSRIDRKHPFDKAIRDGNARTMRRLESTIARDALISTDIESFSAHSNTSGLRGAKYGLA